MIPVPRKLLAWTLAVTCLASAAMSAPASADDHKSRRKSGQSAGNSEISEEARKAQMQKRQQQEKYKEAIRQKLRDAVAQQREAARKQQENARRDRGRSPGIVITNKYPNQKPQRQMLDYSMQTDFWTQNQVPCNSGYPTSQQICVTPPCTTYVPPQTSPCVPTCPTNSYPTTSQYPQDAQDTDILSIPDGQDDILTDGADSPLDPTNTPTDGDIIEIGGVGEADGQIDDSATSTDAQSGSTEIPENTNPVAGLVATSTQSQSTGAGIIIENPKGNPAAVSYLVNQKKVTLKPGQQQRLAAGTAVVEFFRGGNKQQTRHAIKSGKYRFQVAAAGWVLSQARN